MKPEQVAARLEATDPEAAATIRRLVEALEWIRDNCPITCDMSLAHEMAERADTALEGKAHDQA